MKFVLKLAGAVTNLRSLDLVFSLVEAMAQPAVKRPMAATTYVVHHVPGRVRLRVPAKQWDRRYFADVKARLDTCPTVISVDVNSASASVLIRYAGSLDGLLLAEAIAAGLYEFAEISPNLPLVAPDRPLARRLSALIVLFMTAGVQLLLRQLLGAAVPLLLAS